MVWLAIAAATVTLGLNVQIKKKKKTVVQRSTEGGVSVHTSSADLWLRVIICKTE